MEDLWFTTTADSHLHGIYTELRSKADRELPDKRVSGQKIHELHPVEEAFQHRDVSDIRGSDLIQSRGIYEVHQAGVALRRLAWGCGSGLPVDHLSTHAAHGIKNPIAADRDPFAGQVIHYSAAASAGIRQVESIGR